MTSAPDFRELAADHGIQLDADTTMLRVSGADAEYFAATGREAGIAEETLRRAFDDARFVPRVVALDRPQAEFTQTVWDYLDRAVSEQRVARGREKLAEFSAEVAAAAARHGVPAPVLVAIWGMESSYGANYGDIPVIDALATLGFEGRREAWARGQLLAALKILQSGDIDRARMVGSWPGAMGQTQSLPSTFLAYAVDADGDGRRDIWGSMPDVMGESAGPPQAFSQPPRGAGAPHRGVSGGGTFAPDTRPDAPSGVSNCRF